METLGNILLHVSHVVACLAAIDRNIIECIQVLYCLYRRPMNEKLLDFGDIPSLSQLV